MHWIPPLEESLGGLFIRGVRRSSNNVQTTPLIVLFTLSTQSQGHYSHFTLLTTFYWAYYMVTCALLGRCLHLTTPFGPSAPDRRLRLTTVLATGLHWCGRFWPPLSSSCQIVKQGSDPELVMWSSSCLVIPEVPSTPVFGPTSTW
jgi:hypothetical protein